ncbi:MAG TPA: RNA-binding protein [Patescibacteria group bacterium]|nr:RNA-binding protein [Patescibacteria group bacterium]
MATKLFVGNLPYEVNDQSLSDFFSQAGTVTSASVIINKFNNQSKGFGFVEMSSDEEAKNAIETLNGQELSGRKIIVSEARPREERPAGGGGFRSGGSRGGYGGGNRGGYDR